MFCGGISGFLQYLSWTFFNRNIQTHLWGNILRKLKYLPFLVKAMETIHVPLHYTTPLYHTHFRISPFQLHLLYVNFSAPPPPPLVFQAPMLSVLFPSAFTDLQSSPLQSFYGGWEPRSSPVSQLPPGRSHLSHFPPFPGTSTGLHCPTKRCVSVCQS